MTSAQKSTLPARAYVFVGGNAPGDRIGIVKLGEKGYYRTGMDSATLSGARIRTEVRRLNEKLGVSALQQECLFVGSMFGWDVPGADPSTYTRCQIEGIEAEVADFAQLAEAEQRELEGALG